MKALPYITSAICAGLLVVQQVTLSSDSRRNAELRTRIAAVKANDGTDRADKDRPREGAAAQSSPTSSRGGHSADDAPMSPADLDPEELAKAMMDAQRGGTPDLAMIRIQALLLKAAPEELIELVTRTSELDLPDEFKRGFIPEVIAALAEEDPRAALELAFGTEGIDLQRERRRFAGAFKKWMEEDPVSAIAWYDRQLANGNFEPKALDGEQHARVAFEAAAIGALLGSNPSLARQRVTALSENLRGKVFEENLRPTPETALAHAQIVRETLPADQHASVLARANRDFLHHRDYDDLAGYTTQIEASDAERTAIVRSAVQRQFQRWGWEKKAVTEENFTAMQHFLQSEVPERANAIVGVSLSLLARSQQNFDQALEFVLEAHRSAPNDDLLVGFLFHAHVRNKENQPAARALLEQIADPRLREQVRERFNRWHGTETDDE